MFTARAFDNPLLDPPACLEQPLAVAYAALAPKVNDLLCKINTIFFALTTTPDGNQFFKYFMGMYVSAVLLAVYESFRPSSRRSASKRAHGNAEGFGMHLGQAQLATWFIMLGQVVYAAVALQIYYALVAWSTPQRWRRQHHKVDLGDDVFLPPQEREVHASPKHSVQYNANIPRSSFLYTTVISTLVGMVLPALYFMAAPAEEAYTRLSLWQIFPVYMFAINVILPPLLRRSFSSVAPTKAIVLIASLGVACSAYAQYDLVMGLTRGGLKFQDVFLMPDNFDYDAIAANLHSASHLAFVFDFVIIIVSTASYVILALKDKTHATTGGAVSYVLYFLLVSALVGPGASLMLLWAYGEVSALNHARAHAAQLAKEAEATAVTAGGGAKKAAAKKGGRKSK